jgi:hypothetical protein
LELIQNDFASGLRELVVVVCFVSATQTKTTMAELRV